MLRDAVLVALGAVVGAWMRFRIVNHLMPMLPRKHWGTFFVNTLAAFGLGLIASLISAGREPNHRLMLFLGTGFFGSLSTFSTFSVELLQAWCSGARQQALLLLFGSVLVGLAAVLLGMWVGG